MAWRPVGEPKKGWARPAAFRRKAKFLVDESLGIGTTHFLREQRWNAKDVSEVGLSGRSDEEVFAFAFREKRIVLTHDSDFLDDKRFSFHRNPGVVVLPGGSGDFHVFVRSLYDVMNIIAPFVDAYRGAKMEITADRVLVLRNRDATGRISTSRYRYGGQGPVMEWI